LADFSASWFVSQGESLRRENTKPETEIPEGGTLDAFELFGWK